MPQRKPLQPKKSIGGRSKSIGQVCDIILTNSIYGVENDSTRTILEHLKTTFADERSAIVNVSGMLNQVFFTEYGVSLSFTLDASSKNKLFGKGAVFEEEGTFKTPWNFFDETKLFFFIKVKKVEHIAALTADGEKSNNPDDYSSDVKCNFPVKISVWKDFPVAGKAGITLTVGGIVNVKVEESSKKRKKVTIPEAPKKKSKSSKDDDMEEFSSSDDLEPVELFD